MQYYGYMGKILHVDLTSGDIREEDLDLDLARNYIGDLGIGARLIYNLIKPGIDPLSSENPIVIGAGPLCGTSYPGAAKCNVWTKLPLTNTVGHGVGSLSFAAGLKYAGYDELVITGRADKPVYLKVLDDDVEICDATGIWGKDIYEATDEMWRKYGTAYGVMCIGQAGENLAMISMAFIDKSSTIGRHGLGAVMGSKNLKLIITGGRRKVRVYDRARFTELTDDMMTSVMNRPTEYGDLFNLVTRTGVKKYYSERINPLGLVEKFGTKPYLDRVKKARFGCLSCPTACKDIGEIKQGEYKGLLIFASHPMFSLGVQFNFEDIEESIRCTQLLQKYGLDMFALMRHVEFLMELYKQGVIEKSDLEGLELLTEKAVSELIQKIAFRKGIGDAVADGLQGIVSRFGDQCKKYGNYIKGGDLVWDARATGLGVRELELVVSPHPRVPEGGQIEPKRLKIGQEMFHKLGEWLGMSPKSLERVFSPTGKFNVARYLPHSEDFYSAVTCLGLCVGLHRRYFFGIERLAELYSAVTGIRKDGYELKRDAERVWNIYKVLNVREGFSRKDDKFPPKWFEPLMDGDTQIFLKDMFGKNLTQEDTEKLLDDYYDERGWDIEKGIPTREKLEGIGLRDIADDLDHQGILP